MMPMTQDNLSGADRSALWLDSEPYTETWLERLLTSNDEAMEFGRDFGSHAEDGLAENVAACQACSQQPRHQI